MTDETISVKHVKINLISKGVFRRKKSGKPKSRKKVVVIGDTLVGKTSFLRVLNREEYNENSKPTIFEAYLSCHSLSKSKDKGEIAIWDTAGRVKYSELRPMHFTQADLALVCFQIDKPISLKNIRESWLPEFKQYCPNTPYVLIGLKVDIRKAAKGDKNNNSTIISKEYAVTFANSIGAKAYIECSAKYAKGIDKVLEALRNY